MEPEGAWEDCFRISRASAASSICCHSEAAETKAWPEAVGACKGKGVKEWELGTHTSLPHATSALSVPSCTEGSTHPEAFCSSHSLSLAPARVLGPTMFPGYVAAVEDCQEWRRAGGLELTVQKQGKERLGD